MKRTARWLILVLLLLSLSGCWDAREMNHIALVMAVGIDRSEKDPSRFLVTIQVARPGSARSEQAGGGGGGGGGKEPVYTVSADGDTIFAAIRNLAQFTSRRILWAHNNVVVIGEEVAREDITPIVDFFTRNQELRMRTWVVVARGSTAQAVVAAKTGLEDIPANSISAVMRYAFLPGESVRTDMNHVIHAVLTGDQHPVISAVRLTPRAAAPESQGEKGLGLQVELRGTALFNGVKLVGFVDGSQGRGLLWLRDQMKNAVISIPCPNADNVGLAIELRSPEVQIRPDFEGSTPVINLNVRSRAWLSERDCPTEGRSRSVMLQEVAGAVEDDIRLSIEGTLSTLQQELKLDAILFAKRFHDEYPAWWQAHHSEWGDLFPTVQTRINVSVQLGKMGLYIRPLIPKRLD